MLIVRKQIVAVIVSAGTDKVMAWAPIPEGGKLVSVQGALHLLGTEETPLDQIKGYGVSAELVPVVDPDAVALGGATLDTLWDYEVTKPGDVAVSTTAGLDWDWDNSDTGPDVEPGEMDINTMLNALSPTKEIMAPHLEIVSYAKTRPGTYHEETSGTDQWVPVDYKTFRSQRKLVAEGMPHYAMIALSSPTFDEELTGPDLIDTVTEWTLLGNLRSILQDFWKIQAGAAASGAVEPYATAATLIERLVAPPIIQPSTALLTPGTWSALCETTWLLDFPEQQALGMLKGDNM